MIEFWGCVMFFMDLLLFKKKHQCQYSSPNTIEKLLHSIKKIIWSMYSDIFYEIFLNKITVRKNRIVRGEVNQK